MVVYELTNGKTYAEEHILYQNYIGLSFETDYHIRHWSDDYYEITDWVRTTDKN